LRNGRIKIIREFLTNIKKKNVFSPIQTERCIVSVKLFVRYNAVVTKFPDDKNVAPRGSERRGRQAGRERRASHL